MLHIDFLTQVLMVLSCTDNIKIKSTAMIESGAANILMNLGFCIWYNFFNMIKPKLELLIVEYK